MELDLKYKLYEANNVLQEEQNSDLSEARKKVMPYQDVRDNLNKFKHLYNYAEALKLIGTITTDTDINLDDGTIAHILPRNKVIQIALELPNGEKFACIWTSTTSEEEFYSSIINKH